MIPANELTILRNLIHNEDFTRKVLPYLKTEYFSSSSTKVFFGIIEKHFGKYNQCPTKQTIAVDVEELNGLTADVYQELESTFSSLLEKDENKLEWLVDTAEKWCKERAIYLALSESLSIHDDKDSPNDSIPELLSEALAVSFDDHIGHEYLEDYNERYDFYHLKEERIPFGIEYFDKITKGGIPNKTLNIALAGTGVGKSLFMCSFAASVLLQGKNVLYITLEMSEERIAERIDANLLNTPVQDIVDIPRPMFETKVQALQKKTQGKLYIKEYPTASAHAGHFESLLKELQLKKSFRPDIIFVDYINICTSTRYRMASNVNSYTIVKSIAEELRGLAGKYNLPVVSATQTTRSGFSNSDVELTDTSESFGLPATADFMFALISNDEMVSMGQILVKQLKNRYNDLTVHNKFVVGIDRSRMRLYDVDQIAQQDIIDVDSKPDFSSKHKSKSYDDFTF